jgi:hypothetical protein
MMEKEIYNYTNIQDRIRRQKELAREAAITNKEQGKYTFHSEAGSTDDDMVPAIFKEQEMAEDSDAFDSCEDIPEVKE